MILVNSTRSPSHLAESEEMSHVDKPEQQQASSPHLTAPVVARGYIKNAILKPSKAVQHFKVVSDSGDGAIVYLMLVQTLVREVLV